MTYHKDEGHGKTSLDIGAVCNKVLRETRAGSSFKHGAEEGVDGEADWNRQFESKVTVWRWNGRQMTERKAMKQMDWQFATIQNCFLKLYCNTRHLYPCSGNPCKWHRFVWLIALLLLAVVKWIETDFAMHQHRKLSLAASPTLLHMRGEVDLGLAECVNSTQR